MTDEDNFDVLVKLVILGDTAVGKSNYLYRFVDGDFNPVHVSTVGFDFKSRVVEMPKSKKLVKFQIWDTAGQERYMSINKNLFQRVQGIILMYDISKKESFKNLNIWMNHIKENSNGSPIVLIGNKSDLDSDREVNKEEGEKYAKENKMTFFEASAKSGANVEESFLHLGEIIIKDDKFSENREKSKTEYVVSKNTSNKDNKKKCC